MVNCPQCGQAYDGDQCWICLARMADIEETFYFSLCAAGAGIIGTIVASGLYPPLRSYSWYAYCFLGLLVVPGSIVFGLVLCDRLTRYAGLVRLMFAMAAATFVLFAAFLLLNGGLDSSRPVEAQAYVSEKYINNGKGAAYRLMWTLSWNQEKMEQGLAVSRETFFATEQGDSVRVAVHRGALLQPWYSDVVLSTSRDHILR